jgi:hypothetical protein
MTRLAILSSLLLCACLEDPGALVQQCPSVEAFATVAPVLEQRCGSLDCHGNIARPLRIYGQNGLRYANLFDPDCQAGIDAEECEARYLIGRYFGDAARAGIYPGSDGIATSTSQDELRQTRNSICGLEPERMTEVTLGRESPDALLLLTKALRLERHKGDKVFEKGSLDYECVVSWLTSEIGDNVVAVDACNQALALSK